MISLLQKKLDAGEFVVTAEVCPPKGPDCDGFLEKSLALRDYVDCINVTDNQGANMRISPLAASALLAQAGIEPVFQITCRDRNRMALQSDLLGAAALGIVNVLALTGDHISFGDHARAKPVFDLDSVQLLDSISGLNAGRDMAGSPLQGMPHLYPGAAAAPEAEPFPLTLFKLEKKAKAGARFFQTQAIFNPAKLHAFHDAVSHLDVKIIAGVLLIKSAGMARYVNANIPGLNVPPGIIAELENAPSPITKGVEIARRLVSEIRPFCHGIHVMVMGREELIPDIIEEVRECK
jgi:5,10-methylenetetrahydrofolate reductase